jgi:GAF domain-containing protein
MGADRARTEEAQRLAELRAYGIDNADNEPALDALVHQVARVCAAPIALISLVDEQRQWFKARVGVDVREIPRTISFCTHAIRGTGVFVVKDARLVEPFCQYPYVTGEPGVRFYAGAPLITPAGRRLGTVCILDTAHRDDISPALTRSLERFAARAMEVFAARAPQATPTGSRTQARA